MKIKELHIRNIASIEKADIDFENELVDPVTGTTSGIFLISGDTGTGKTVILDTISMALYKRTPRIEDVANKKNNDYTDNEGQSISINSIEQYTRLGISEKDPCYSELIFEGNDGEEYHARLELGIVKSITDANGNRPLKHRSPKWLYKKGTEDWQRVDSRGQVLVDAVGLSFEQFGRMAMLAQGQFAAFLTGDKSERESILEQLTNTSKFSVYGKVISNLFSSAKAKRIMAQTTYDAEKEHTLPAEELQTLANELDALKKQKETLDLEYKAECDKLQLVDNLAGWKDVHIKTELEKVRLETLIASDVYQRNKLLVNDWDVTNHERQMFFSKQQAERRKNTAIEQLFVAQEIFNRLSSDLLFRDNVINGMKDEYLQLMKWLNDRIPFDSLFTNAVAVDLRLVQYKENVGKINEVKQRLLQEKERTQFLQIKLNECLKSENLAKTTVASKQESIIKLQNERHALNPQEISAEKDLALHRKLDLERLQDRIKVLEETRHTANLAQEEISNEEIQLEQLREAYVKSQNIYDQRLKDEALTRSLLSTMQMSLEDTLTELRLKMQETHAEICPLCGQRVEKLHFSEEFNHILTPLQQREEEAKLLLSAASKQRDADKTAYDKLKGVLYSKKKEFEKNLEAIQKEDQDVKAFAEKLLLNPDEEFLSQIDVLISKVNRHICQLDTMLNKAEDLQKAINQLSTEKIPLDEAVTKAGCALQNVRNDVENNRNRIIEQEKVLESYKEEQILLESNLNNLFSSYSTIWQENIPSIQQRLKLDAEIYLGKKKLAEKLASELNKIEAQQESLRSVCSRILQRQPAWTVSDESIEYLTSDINDVWTQLYAQIEHQQEAIKEADKILNETSASLDFYYKFSCKTEQDLLCIIAQEKDVAEARTYVSRIDSEYKSCCDAMNHATMMITSLLHDLKVEKIEDVPEKSFLQIYADELFAKQQELVGKIGGIEEKLNVNKTNEQKFDKAKHELDKSIAVYEKWDRMNKCFGGTRFRTLVQTYILRPLLNNANIYLERITDRYVLTCSEDNEQLSILVLDRYNKNQVRSVTVLSGGERFMISLALSLALSSLNRQDMNVNILFIDEGFGTLDETNLNSVIATLEKLQEIAGQNNRRVGIISHREELVDRIAVKINVKKKGEGRSIVEITKE